MNIKLEQEIDGIINCCINDYISNGQIIREEYVKLITNLYPKWRVPSVDGFPDDYWDCLYMLDNGLIVNDCLILFAEMMDKKFIVKWIPKDEFLKIMEVNK